MDKTPVTTVSPAPAPRPGRSPGILWRGDDSPRPRGLCDAAVGPPHLCHRPHEPPIPREQRPPGGRSNELPPAPQTLGGQGVLGGEGQA